MYKFYWLLPFNAVADATELAKAEVKLDYGEDVVVLPGNIAKGELSKELNDPSTGIIISVDKDRKMKNGVLRKHVIIGPEDTELKQILSKLLANLDRPDREKVSCWFDVAAFLKNISKHPDFVDIPLYKYWSVSREDYNT